MTKGFEKSVTEEYVLRIASSEEEGRMISEFNEIIHEEGIGSYVQRLYNSHHEILWFYIEDIVNSKIVSSLALMPLKWVIRGQQFDVAEMGFVGTLEEYRGQGLFGVLNEYFNMAVIEMGFVAATLVGIPNYYRKFGYEFALTRLTGYYIPTSNIPSDQVETINIRKATADDLKLIGKLYQNYNEQYAVYTAFNSEDFHFRLMNDTCDNFNSITYIIEEDRKPQAFFTIGSMEDDNRADIILVSVLTEEQMIKMLQFVKKYNVGNIQHFKVNVLRNSQLGRFLSHHGADSAYDWPWQIHIPDWNILFNAFIPIFESRIANSIYRGITRDVRISNYARTITISFERGKITDVNIVREFPSKDVDLRIPSPFEIKLFFSDKSVEDIQLLVPDTLIKQDSKLLISTLFPKIDSIPFSYYQ